MLQEACGISACSRDWQLKDVSLTNGDAGVRSYALDVGLGDGAHADLIECAREERRKGADERDGALAAPAPNAHSHQVLLSNETLDETVWERLLEGDGEGRVLGVAVHPNDTCARLSQLLQGCAVCFPSGNLRQQNRKT